MELIPDLQWNVVVLHIRDLLFAFILALPIGWDREKNERTAGLRTFPLVAIASCGYMLVGMQVLDSSDAEARVMQGIIAGIGFIGGGAILKNAVEGAGSVSGTATAASLWLTGAIGISVATGRLEIAIILSLLTFFTLRLLTPAKILLGTAAANGTAAENAAGLKHHAVSQQGTAGDESQKNKPR